MQTRTTTLTTLIATGAITAFGFGLAPVAVAATGGGSPPEPGATTTAERHAGHGDDERRAHPRRHAAHRLALEVLTETLGVTAAELKEARWRARRAAQREQRKQVAVAIRQLAVVLAN